MTRRAENYLGLRYDISDGTKHPSRTGSRWSASQIAGGGLPGVFHTPLFLPVLDRYPDRAAVFLRT
jgi:hypothetical protein